MIEGVEDASDLRVYCGPMQPKLQLRLVCKLFKALYGEHAHLLLVDASMTMRRLPGLLTWLRKSQVSIRLLDTDCETSVVDSLLSAWAVLNAPLTSVNVQASQSSVDLLPSFSSLAKVCLYETDKGGQHELSALQVCHISQTCIWKASFVVCMRWII